MSQLIFSICLALAGLQAAQADSANIRIVSTAGKVTVGSKVLHANDEIPPDSNLQVGTDANSFVDLKLPEGHQIRLKSGTSVTFPAMTKTRVLQLLRGTAFIHYNKSPKAPPLQVRTRTVVAGVRGTKFMAEFDEKKGSYICVCEGTVEAQKENGGATQPIHAGQDLWSREGEELKPAANSPGMAEQTAVEFKTMDY